MAEDFIKMVLVKNETGQQIELVRKDGTKEVYGVDNFPYRGGGPVITGKYDIKFKKEG